MINEDSRVGTFVNHFSQWVVIGMAPKLQRFFLNDFIARKNYFHFLTIHAVSVSMLSTTPKLTEMTQYVVKTEKFRNFRCLKICFRNWNIINGNI